MDECNGWANYPTWSVYNWIINDESSYIGIRNYIGELYEDYEGDLLKIKETLANTLRENLEFQNPIAEEDASLYVDILGWTIGIIDYYDIASAIVDGEEW